MNFDAIWDAWAAAGHDVCGGWRYDPGQDGGVATCACGTVIPQANEALDAERSGADCVGPGTGWDPLAVLELDGDAP